MARELDDVLGLALRLAREAGAIQKARSETGFRIDTKSRPVDLVTEVDHACEAHLVVSLLRERPHDAVLAEEGRGTDTPGPAFRWVIDPLDGTTNFAHGYPRFAVSIGVERDGEPAVGVVYDPLLDECYHAALGGGSFATAGRSASRPRRRSTAPSSPRVSPTTSARTRTTAPSSAPC